MHITQDVGPESPGLHTQNGHLFVQFHLMKAEHIQDDAARSKRLPAHRVAHAGYAERQLPGTCMLKVCTKLFFGIVVGSQDRANLCNLRPVQATGVVDKACGYALKFVPIVQRSLQQMEKRSHRVLTSSRELL